MDQHSNTKADPAALSDAEWQQRLTPEQFKVLRKHATERAGTSPLNHEKRPGTFVCAGCGTELFDAATKYESGSGWPSFYTPIEGAVAPRWTGPGSPPAPKCIAPAAKAISAMSSMTARRRPGCGFA